ncbi:BACON domain-containing protein [Streptomyces sp. TE33382]
MTSSRLETPTHTTGAHRAHRRAPHSSAQRTPAWYEQYLDGLFTYCLSVLCDHEAAADALGAVLAIAEREDSRCPAGEEERKTWLYALARWMCLRRLAERKRGRQAHRHSAKEARAERARTAYPNSARPKPAPSESAPPEGTRPGSARPAAARTGAHTGHRTLGPTPGASPADRILPADRTLPIDLTLPANLPLATVPAIPTAPAIPTHPAAPTDSAVLTGPTAPTAPVVLTGPTAPAIPTRPTAPYAPDTPPTPEEAVTPAPAESPAAEARRRELAQLAWPEAAGTTPEQREALELSVRHGLPPRAVASVLGLEPATARELLAAAACEVERTRAALAVVETADCPTVARLTGDHRVLLSAVLRRELVRHVDDCPRCRLVAERAGAAGPWPGATVTSTTVLPVVEAPRPSVHVAMVHAQRSRAGTPRFDRAGYPLDPKDQAARRDRLRARVVTTTVVATVVAAPVIALWAAYRGAPHTGEGHDGSTVTATELDDTGGMEGTPYDHYENAGNARPGDQGRFGDRPKDGSGSPDVTAEVISSGGGRHGPGGLDVTARTSGDVTTIALTASGGAPVTWSAWVDAPWLRLSRSSGVLAAGASVTIRVSVNHAAAPAGPWRARIGIAPTGSLVMVEGYGAASPSDGGATGPARPTTKPTDPGRDPTGPTPGPTGPTDPTPGPTDPTGPTPGPTDSTDPGPGTTGPTPTSPGSSEPTTAPSEPASTD